VGISCPINHVVAIVKGHCGSVPGIRASLRLFHSYLDVHDTTLSIGYPYAEFDVASSKMKVHRYDVMESPPSLVIESGRNGDLGLKSMKLRTLKASNLRPRIIGPP